MKGDARSSDYISLRVWGLGLVFQVHTVTTEHPCPSHSIFTSKELRVLLACERLCLLYLDVETSYDPITESQVEKNMENEMDGHWGLRIL